MATPTVPATVVGDATVGELRDAVAGEVIARGDPGYDEARAIWNAAHDRYPALVVRCSGAADVIETVTFARSQGLPLAVRGGSHSIAGFSTCDGGVVVDLSPMRAVIVDPVGRRAIVQGGATWADVDHETQAFGLATPGGLISTTGVGGFTLGGGIGWLLRRHGLACDNLVAAEVVTADGRLVRAAPDADAELLWALRGGGGNFGVATTLEFALHPVGPTVLGGLLFFPAEAARQVVTGWRELTASMPDDLTSLVNLTTAPPVPFLPEAVHGQPVAVVGAVYAGPAERGEAAVGGLRTLAEPILDMLGPVPYAAMQQALDPLWGRGAHNYFTSAILDGLPDEAVDEALARWAAKPTPQSEMHVHHAGGAMARVGRTDTAYAQRDEPFVLNVIARSPAADGFDEHVRWARDTRDLLAGYGPGALYVNFTGEGGEDKVRAAYPPDVYARLVAVKDRLDPTNLFRLNQNIRPSA